MLPYLVGYDKRLIRIEAEEFFGFAQVFVAQRGAVGFAAARLWGAVADLGSDGDDRRAFGVGLSRPDCRVDGLEIVAIGDLLGVPAIGVEAGHAVFGKGEVGGSVERNQVVVVEIDQLAQLEVPGQRSRRGWPLPGQH